MQQLANFSRCAASGGRFTLLVEGAMARARQTEVVEAIRRRVLGGLESGALDPGVRLPSTREIAAGFHADPRVVAAAYRALAAEGLVELRPRSGAYVAPTAGVGRWRQPSMAWAVDSLSNAITQGVPLPSVARHLEAFATAESLEVFVAATMSDQVDGLVRELKQNFGFRARGLIVDNVTRLDRWPRALERADLILTTPAHARHLGRLDRGPTRTVVIAGVNPRLLPADWRLLVKGLRFVVVADPRFAKIVREFLGDAPDAKHVSIRVAGRDRLNEIGPDDLTYITEAARRVIGRARLPGRLVPRGRILDDASVRRIVEFLVERNTGRARS